MIRFEQVSKTYPGGFHALQNVSFKISKGEMIFVAGHSGAGKSTVLQLMAGITKPTSGKVWMNNQDLGTLNDSRLGYLRQHIGLVFQDHKILFDRNVLQNVLLPLRIIGYDRATAEKRARIAQSEGLKIEQINLATGEREAEIKKSEGEAQAAMNASEGEKVAQINRAEGEAQALRLVAQASADAIRTVAAAIQEPGGDEAVKLKVAEQYVEAFAKLAKESNTVIMPANVADLGGLISAGLSIVKGQPTAK